MALAAFGEKGEPHMETRRTPAEGEALPAGEDFTGPLAVYNRLYKALDDCYHRYARAQGISDMVLWLLYPLYERGAVHTQKSLCEAWHYPAQTVNSALKGLERQGLLTLERHPGEGRNKRIVLTGRGRAYMQRVIGPLVQAEQRAFLDMPEAERTALLSLTRRYAALLNQETSALCQ